MLNRRWRLVCCVILIAVCTSAAFGQSTHADIPIGVKSETVAYTPGWGGIQLVKVTVNRTQTATFAFDSGTNRSLISDTLVKRLKLKSSPALSSSGVPMDQIEPGKPTQSVLLSPVVIGHLSFVNSAFMVVDAKRFSATFGRSVDGVLGANVAAKCPMLLDFQKHQLTFFFRHSLSPDDLRKIGMGDAVSVSVRDVDKNSHYKFPIKVTNGSNSAEGEMMLDTGSDQTYISGILANQLHLKPQSHGPVSTFYGPIATSDATVSSLQFGEITLTDFPVNYVDEPKIVSTFNNNVLGLEVLSRFQVLLDYPDGKIYFRLSPVEAAPPPTTNARPGLAPARLLESLPKRHGPAKDTNDGTKADTQRP